MTQLNCIIIDQEAQGQESLARSIRKYCPSVRIVGVAPNIRMAVELIENISPNLVFLDADIKRGTGFKLFEKIAVKNFFTVVTSKKTENEQRTLSFPATDFLQKPIQPIELMRCVEKIHDRMKQEFRDQMLNPSRVISVRQAKQKKLENDTATPAGIEFLKPDTIIRCEANRAYCRFHLVDDRKIFISRSLKEFESALLQANFFRVHKSHMINMSHVQRYYHGKFAVVELSDGSKINVAIRRKDQFLKRIIQENRNISIDGRVSEFAQHVPISIAG